MAHSYDPAKTSLNQLKDRIKTTDLIPSRTPLQQNLNSAMETLAKHGITNVAELQQALKNTKSINELSSQTGLNTDYLTLLRREIEGYVPKTYPISSFDWLDPDVLKKLQNAGFTKSTLLYDALNTMQKRKELGTTLQIDLSTLENIYLLVNLTRIQWTSPLFARMLLAAGYDTPEKIADANAERLCETLDIENKKNKFFKGKIGLRDIKRLIHGANYV